MTQFREEIIEQLRFQNEALRWKLIIVAALGTAGLGIPGADKDLKPVMVILALIPLVCIYVDLIYRQTTLRLLTIGNFLRSKEAKDLETDGDLSFKLESRYEEFIYKVRPFQNFNPTGEGTLWKWAYIFLICPRRSGVVDFEGWALHLSTLFLSGLIIITGVIGPDTISSIGSCSSSLATDQHNFSILFCCSGAIGIVFTGLLFVHYRYRVKRITECGGPPTDASNEKE